LVWFGEYVINCSTKFTGVLLVAQDLEPPQRANPSSTNVLTPIRY